MGIRDQSILQWQCELCVTVYNSKQGLNYHMEAIHSNETPFKCSQCDEVFTTSSNLQTHMRVHNRDKPFKCTLCHKAFVQGSNLASHIRGVHDGEKPFKCTLCDKAFTKSSNLAFHMRVHD